MSGIRLGGSRRFSSKPWQVREPELDERAHLLLEARLARQLERLQERLAHLLRINSLLQPVVPGYEKFLYLFSNFFFLFFQNSPTILASST
jgi:hypothetical protein